VIGTIWIIFTRPDIGLFGVGINSLDLLGSALRPHGQAASMPGSPAGHGGLALDALVALLAYAGLRAIPEAYTRRPKLTVPLPGPPSSTFSCPKCAGVLTIAVLLRWMDSFLIYAEPFALTGGGPGNTTTFLSIYLVKLATMQFDLGRPRPFRSSIF
jgi:glycerol transport system permease protein